MNRHIAFKDTQREIHNFRLRLALSIGFVLLLLSILLARFVYLQVVQQNHYQTLAEKNRISIMPIAPSRGLIFDRNGVILAQNYSAYTLEITSSKVADLKTTIDELAKLIDIQPRDRKRFKRLLANNRKFESLPIRSRLTDGEVARFSVQRYRFPGVELKARLFREYPYHEQISHLLGYVGRINERDIAQLEKDEIDANYRGSDYIGRTGIEQSYERELHGKTGFQQVEVDADGREVRVLSRTPPVSGSNLILTIDAKLQEVAEQAFGNYRGALVAIDPSNGEVLAFVSKPGYDPNLFIEGIDQQSWDELNNSPDLPLNNRALRGQYPPGSTIKPFMALAGLHYNMRTPGYTISDPGYFTLPGSSRRYRDWKKAGHGNVDLFKSIVVSCDTYYYGLATELGIDSIHSFFSEFGFGKKTGIDMKGEVSGLMPSQEWKQKRHKKKWYVGDTVSVGVGQGYSLVTPLQLAYATATLANDGVAYRPHLLKEVQSSHTSEKQILGANIDFSLNLNSEHFALVKSAMVAVTQTGGTAAMAGAGASYAFAGKTGTAQVIGIKQGEEYIESKVQKRYRDHAWFMAFAPFDQPKIALAVLVENGGHGGSIAAPIARKVFDYFLLGKMAQPLLKMDEGEEGIEND
ncbi:penicillin-binding protein 2 [Candidatus Nitrotoga sp. M5]|uniref:penicillin-binding protein 2 n=1 Tax=Candidatus Nitrotoga sp. M5 TaxID=2890409 RepID=UPI001EF1D895|nr:penicillin-binding protein 2 [Candidatus Nitrotoga sp. M5]CAH1385632.1 peptidoglycan DD-transpeptidase MrdA [Candidatus Nitrotoga sp. M5]